MSLEKFPALESVFQIWGGGECKEKIRGIDKNVLARIFIVILYVTAKQTNTKRKTQE